MEYKSRVKLIAKKILEYVFVKTSFKYDGQTQGGMDTFTYSCQMTLHGELTFSLPLTYPHNLFQIFAQTLSKCTRIR